MREISTHELEAWMDEWVDGNLGFNPLTRSHGVLYHECDYSIVEAVCLLFSVHTLMRG